MPQMAPLSWLTLFIVFSITLILFGVMNYFLFNPEAPESSSSQFKTSPFNWKW
uniref:ATP synthase complex subunit 8 n=1 Tax=Heptageniidae sp. YW03BF02 TaxID=2860733 RepID=A0A8F6YGZ8_9INSE|nr:ATP synthase F0 subunit 8 [Heptagenia ngi]QXT45750.1 ATP synthase F0 subunit 8 [Heptageniidae sp. YW03BF02]QZZ23909.1 ATP synthase F0 subunit 8 [Heptagenia ngi]